MRKIAVTLCFLICTFVLFAQQEVFIKDGSAIQGYDAVAYFNDRKPVKGEEKFMYTWRNASWKFSSQENLDAFKAEPEKFAPQFGGYCAYGMMEGHKAPTSPDAWSIVDGKLYLNYNKNVRELWNKNQSEYIQTAIKNWPVVKLEND